MGSGGSIPSTPDIIGEHQSSVDPHDQRSPRLVNEQNDLPLCLIHSRVIEFYCNQCDLDLCSKCIVSIHKGHDFILIEEKNLHKKTDKEQNQDSKEEKDERQRKKSIPNKISSQGGSFSSHSHPHLASYNFQQYPNQDPKSLATSASSRGGGAAAGTSKPVSRQGSNLNLNLITFPPPPSKSDNVSTSSKSSSSSKTIPFPFYGMSMRLLKALYQYVKSIDPNDQMTTLDVSEQIIKPWTEKYHCSLAELFLTDYMFQPHEVLKLNASQSVSTHPTVFVSHAWRYKFSELISAISSFDRSHQKDLPLFGAGAVAGSAEDEEQDFQVIYDPKSLDLSLTGGGGGGGNGSDFAEQSNSYWIDVCVNNQWEAPKLPYEWWSSTFLTAIGKIGHTCLVLSPWDDPIPLKRAWCLWEIVCTKTTHSQFTVQFSPSERIKFQHVLRMNFEYIMKAISCIDLESSEAWNPADREMIFDVVRRLDGGFQAVNMILFDVLREWLSESGKDAIDFSENIYYYDSYEKMKNNLYLMNNVGQLMKEQGKYEEAEHLYRLALSGYHRIDWKRHEKEKKERKMREREEKRERRKERKVSQGEEGEEGEGEGGEGEEEGEEGDDDEEEEQDHHLSTTNNLAILLNITGRRSEAEILFKEILQAYIRRYGDEDKDTLAIKNNLANIYNDKGDRNLASAMYEEVLGGYLKILGKSNPETLSCMHNLATVWNDQGKTVEAEELMRETLELQCRILGKEHPTTLITMNNLALILYDQRKLQEAEVMYLDTLKGQEKVIGKNHPKVYQTLGNLANLYRDRGDIPRAEDTYHRVISGQTETLGLDHPDTLLSMNNLANLLSDIGKLEEAEEMYVRSLAGQRRTIGDDHEETIGTKYNLGILYHQLNRLDEAEKFALEAYQNYCSRFGVDHINTLSACYNVAVVKKAKDSFTEAEFFYRQTLSGQQLYLGADHEDTIRTMKNLAVLLQQKDDRTEAEDLYSRILTALENKPSLDESNELAIDILAKYGDLLFEKDDYLLAQKIFEKLAEFLEGKRKGGREEEGMAGSFALVYEEIWMETQEKLELVREVNSTEDV